MSWWNPWRSAREEARADRELLFKTLEAIMTAAGAQARAAAEQAAALRAHMELFRVADGATGWVNRDEDEYLAELERKGFPRNGTQEEQLRWVQANMGDEQLYELRAVND